MRKSGINLEKVRNENRSLIIKCINNGGPMSRKDIAEKTGLTAASVTQITTLLISEGILSELGSVAESTGTAGRKKVLLDINSAFCYVCSVSIETEVTTIAICDIKGELFSKDAFISFPTDAGISASSFLAKIADNIVQISGCLSKGLQKKLSCVSVGIPGIVDKENGVAVHAYGIWDTEVRVKEILEKDLETKLKTPMPVMLTNNVDAFATAEILFGAGRSYDSLLIIKWGPGVGSTIVIDGKVYEGRHGKTAELGHFIVDKNGQKCSCGRRGCLETLLSYKALSKQFKFKIQSFGELALAGPKENREKIEDLIDIFAQCIVNTCTIIAPNRIILSGSLFTDKVIRELLITACSKYDGAYNSSRICYTTLYNKESYIGPVAAFISTMW